jgi:hypothetical protein
LYREQPDPNLPDSGYGSKTLVPGHWYGTGGNGKRNKSSGVATNQYPVLWIRIRPPGSFRIPHYFLWIRILSSSNKKSKKHLDISFFYFFYFLSLKNDVNEHPKSTVISKTTLKNNIFFVGSCQPLTKKQDPDPSPDP